MEQNKTDVLSIIGLVLGILSILMGCCCTWLGLILGIAGVICSIIGNKNSKTGLGTAALICSIVGCVFAVLGVIIGLFSSSLNIMAMLLPKN